MPDDDRSNASTIARTITAIADIGRDDWNTLANPNSRPYNPFISFEFLKALEESGSVCQEAGWTPLHIIIEQDGQPIGAAPLYAKGHSQGEYIFDHHWADAYHQAGGSYYPKLLCAAPFTPVQGPRLLGLNSYSRQLTANALRGIAEKFDVSSLHINFIEKDDYTILDQQGFNTRIGIQYHWFNKNYDSYNDFLQALSSRKRKTIRRERRDALQGNIQIKHLRGTEISPLYWDAFWGFYQNTGARKWGTPYLTRQFFYLISETMSKHLLMIVAEVDSKPIAGALNFIGGDTLYGRYWGCSEDHTFLHFEVCYHQAIEFAIKNKLARVEAGAQGEHKLARGYEPVATHSAHWIRDANFRNAIDRYLENECQHSKAEIEALKAYTPFKKG